MVFMKKIVMLSRKGTFFFFFFFPHISFPSTRHLLFFIPFFSIYSSVSSPRTLHTPPYPLPRRSSLSTGLLVKATALRAELRTSQKEFGDKNYLEIQTSPNIPVFVGNPFLWDKLNQTSRNVGNSSGQTFPQQFGEVDITLCSSNQTFTVEDYLLAVRFCSLRSVNTPDDKYTDDQEGQKCFVTLHAR